MPSHKVKFDICGSSYVVSTDDTEEHILRIANRLDTDMKALMRATPSASVTSAAVVTALGYLDSSVQNAQSADNMRASLQGYLEDAANARLAAEEAKQEAERLRAELAYCKEQHEKERKEAAKAAAAPPLPPPPLVSPTPEPEALPPEVPVEENLFEKPYPGQIRLEEL